MRVYRWFLRISRQLFVLSLALMLAQAADAQPVPKSPKEVLDRFHATVGTARSATMRHRHIISEITMGTMPASTAEMFMSGDRLLLTSSPMPGATSQTGSDGKVAWTMFNGEPMLLADSVVKSLRQSVVDPMSVYNEARSMKLGDARDFRGERIVPLHVVLRDGTSMTQLFSLRSGLVLAMRMATPDSGDAEPDMVFEDYRTTEGIMMAHRITTRVPGQGEMVMKVTHVDYRAPADSLFALPKAVQALLPKSAKDQR